MSRESRTPAVGVEGRAEKIHRGRVVYVADDGSVTVECPGAERLVCDLLHTGGQGEHLLLSASDEVLIWLPGEEGGRGVVLGRVGPSRAPDRDQVPDELVLQARKNLTLKVGDGSITIREDGKILIKGKDLVSHAKRMNRIKGGAVSIN